MAKEENGVKEGTYYDMTKLENEVMFVKEEPAVYMSETEDKKFNWDEMREKLIMLKCHHE